MFLRIFKTECNQREFVQSKTFAMIYTSISKVFGKHICWRSSLVGGDYCGCFPPAFRVVDELVADAAESGPAEGRAQGGRHPLSPLGQRHRPREDVSRHDGGR